MSHVRSDTITARNTLDEDIHPFVLSSRNRFGRDLPTTRVYKRKVFATEAVEKNSANLFRPVVVHDKSDGCGDK